jgi:hypothetical protein
MELGLSERGLEGWLDSYIKLIYAGLFRRGSKPPEHTLCNLLFQLS